MSGKLKTITEATALKKELLNLQLQKLTRIYAYLVKQYDAGDLRAFDFVEAAVLMRRAMRVVVEDAYAVEAVRRDQSGVVTLE